MRNSVERIVESIVVNLYFLTVDWNKSGLVRISDGQETWYTTERKLRQIEPSKYARDAVPYDIDGDDDTYEYVAYCMLCADLVGSACGDEYFEAMASLYSLWEEWEGWTLARYAKTYGAKDGRVCFDASEVTRCPWVARDEASTLWIDRHGGGYTVNDCNGGCSVVLHGKTHLTKVVGGWLLASGALPMLG